MFSMKSSNSFAVTKVCSKRCVKKDTYIKTDPPDDITEKLDNKIRMSFDIIST